MAETEASPQPLVARKRPFHVTIVHPCVGRRAGSRSYMNTWKMEPLPAALVSALLPKDVERTFFDDRIETLDYDRPTDLVAISVETYTARRAYQIASEYRRRKVPVVMGGFHATLCPEEVQRYADSVVVGEAENVLPELIDDYRHGTPGRIYRGAGRTDPSVVDPDRSLFRGKRYLPIRLVEFARGCRFRCEFCAVQAFHSATQTHRRLDPVLAELRRVRRPGQLVFFIDDNIVSDLAAAKELMRALIPLKIRWISQASINVAFDDEALSLMKRSGCQGLLVGFESLDTPTLRQMNKGFNASHGGPPRALERFRAHGLRIYGTFVFGYDHDTDDSFDKTLEFAQDQGLFIAAFNHITPFPGTPLYRRLEGEGRLLMDPWWLDESYRYGQVPFRPRQLSPEQLARRCIEARRRFYGWTSIGRRLGHWVNLRDPLMAFYFVVINAMHQIDVDGRHGLPLGDQGHHIPLLEVG
ncbi:MAG: B12-binding domain-containing radical SAM protein [Acidobacteria bacterium]|nr:B12-binding domain-containing radical SAM protein [Acidobacteriota bacterium]